VGNAGSRRGEELLPFHTADAETTMYVAYRKEVIEFIGVRDAVRTISILPS
jgi:hypothetical protein